VGGGGEREKGHSPSLNVTRHWRTGEGGYPHPCLQDADIKASRSFGKKHLRSAHKKELLEIKKQQHIHSAHINEVYVISELHHASTLKSN
jgi:hypothetical protein